MSRDIISRKWLSLGTYRHSVLLLIGICFFFIAWSDSAMAENGDEAGDFYYSQHFEDGFLLKEFISFIPEDSRRYSIEEIVALPDSLFFTHKDLPGSFGDTRTFWLKFKVVNDTDERRQDYVASAFAFDSVEIYSKKYGSLDFEALTGYGINPRLKRIPSRRSLVNFDLRPREEIEFYIRGTLRNSRDHLFLANIFIFEDFYATNSNVYYRNFNRIFLTTILFILAVFSLVIFFTFRERIFITYAVLMSFFTLYFLDFNFLIDYLVYLPNIFYMPLSSNIIATGIVLFLYLFISGFLDLISKKPLYSKFFLSFTIVTCLYGIIKPFFLSGIWPGQLFNFLLLIFTLLCLIPIAQLSLKGVKEARVLFYSMVLLFAGALIHLLNLLEILPAGEFGENSFLWGVIAFSSTLFYGLFDKINTVQREKIQFRAEKEKSDELLFNILPFEVATELKEKGFCEAKNYPKVSVLFTDFKDFTTTSTQLSAKELVHEVNSCFVAFDNIVGKYMVEKIKTIGDSYMAASGLEIKTEVEVKGIVLAAIEMQEFLLNRKMKLHTNDQHVFEMRVGIHTGPLVAGIVGVKKFQYDLWGDTVNTASRLESHGEVGKVNISDATYQFIKDDSDFTFEKREGIEVKGKGKLNMWFVHKSNTAMEREKITNES